MWLVFEEVTPTFWRLSAPTFKLTAFNIAIQEHFFGGRGWWRGVLL